MTRPLPPDLQQRLDVLTSKPALRGDPLLAEAVGNLVRDAHVRTREPDVRAADDDEDASMMGPVL